MLFNIIAWYILLMCILTFIVDVFMQPKDKKTADDRLIGFIIQIVPMFLLACHVLGWLQ